MKKLSLLLCSMVFMSAMATQAACPCKTDPCTCKPPCESTCNPGCTPCCPVQPACPTCNDDKPVCCDTPVDMPIKEESCCYQLSQTDLFKKLCLDQCQMDKACCLFNKYKCDSQCIKDSLKCERAKLCKMIKCCACDSDVRAQKKKIKDLRNDLKDKWACYQDEFKELLTGDQKRDFRQIKREETRKYNKLMRNKCCCEIK